MASSAPDLVERAYRVVRRGETIRLTGDLRMHDAAAIWRDLRHEMDAAQSSMTFDLRSVHAADGSVMALIVDLRRELVERGVKAELVCASEKIEKIVNLYAGHEGVARGMKRKPESVGPQGRGDQDPLVSSWRSP